MNLPLINVVGHGLDWMTLGQALGWIIGMMVLVVGILCAVEADASKRTITIIAVIGLLICSFALYCGIAAKKYPIEQYYVANWSQINLDELKDQCLIVNDTTHNTITIIREIK